MWLPGMPTAKLEENVLTCSSRFRYRTANYPKKENPGKAGVFAIQEKAQAFS
jgi:hypothetical protein